jgi:predicted metal-binding membrane protein
MGGSGAAIRLATRARVMLILSLSAMVALSWLYLAWMAVEMARAGEVGCYRCAAMPGAGSSAVAYVAWLVAMWSVMALAMMLPAAMPMLLLYGRFHRGRHPDESASAPTLHLAAGYLLVWIGFGIAGSALQWTFERAGALTPVMGQIRSPLVAGLVLIGAGLFQLSRLKQACLSRCRTPLGFFITEWRDGRRGALSMGAMHGLVCLGCCWALMLVMFVAGVMNVLWMAALTVLILVEKLVPGGQRLARAAGLALIAAGAYLVLSVAALR